MLICFSGRDALLPSIQTSAAIRSVHIHPRVKKSKEQLLAAYFLLFFERKVSLLLGTTTTGGDDVHPTRPTLPRLRLINVSLGIQLMPKLDVVSR
jgi:hypothetical protein